MIARRPPRSIVVAALLMLCGGCAMSHVEDVRLYDYNSGLLSNGQLFSLGRGHGRATAQMFSGEVLQGEYAVTRETTAALPTRQRLAFDPALAARKEGEANPAPAEAPQDLAKVFGFAPGSAARPMAVATLIGDRGSVLEIVFYALDVETGTGSGVARDNRGNWYIVRMGEQ